MTDYLSTDPNEGEDYLSTDAAEGAGGKLLGGKEASLGVGAPESLWDKAKTAIMSVLTPDADRAEAKAAGVGLNPTGAELLQGVGMIAAPMAAPGALAGVGNGVARLGGVGNIASRTISGAQGAKRGYKTAGPIGAVAGGVIGAMNPVSTGAVEGAISGAEAGGLPGAVGGAVLGTITGGGASKIAKIAALAKTAEAVSDVNKVAKATKAVKTAEEAKSVFDASKLAAREFAKANSKKMGEKVWMLLEDGLPVKKLTPDQAAAAARKGLETTWVKNVWGGS
jgi:hypothetical protein